MDVINLLEKLIVPASLKPGDLVAAITLSWGGPGTFPYRFEVGKQRLESLFGVQVIPTRHALKSADWLYRNPQARADDLMEAFSDPSIKGIVSTIGGDDAIRLLPWVDFKVIQNNPKIFMGFSDTTVIHFMCLKAGVRSYYGPSVMTAFSENVAMHDYSIQGVRSNLFSNKPLGVIPQNREGWTTELLDWGNELNQNIQRKLFPPTGWHFIGANKICKGRLIGGCLEVLEFLNGTALWPELFVWDHSILFLETSEEGVAPSRVIRFMRNLAAQGILERLQGILFSKPGGSQITAARFPEYDAALLQVFEEYQLPIIPIVTQMDFGHSDPHWTLPYGALIQINPVDKTVVMLENSVC